MALAKCRECGADVSTEAQTCPSCGVPNPSGDGRRDSKPDRARIKKSSELAGAGCAIQALGIVAGMVLIAILPVIGWVIGPLFILLMLIYGSRKSLKYTCGACGNRIDGPKVKRCPVCHVALSR